jgi:hypothetical protein
VLRTDHPEADAIRLGYLIAAALRSAQGREEVAAAERRLQDLVTRGRFNSVRAMKIYAVAVDKAVWASLKDLPSRRHLYRSYQASGLREMCGRQLLDAFKSETGEKEQPLGAAGSVAVWLRRLALGVAAHLPTRGRMRIRRGPPRT